MRFWRERLDRMKEGFQEGAAEGRREAEQELASDPEYQRYLSQVASMRREVAQIPEKIAPLSQAEQFMVALAAPYRSIYLEIAYGGFQEIDQGRAYFWMDWKGDGLHHDLRFPLSMFAFGRPELMPREKQDSLRRLLRRDFGATDRNSVYQAAAPLAMYFGENLDLYLGADARTQKGAWTHGGRPTIPTDWGAFYVCALAQLLTAAGDAGYGEREALMDCFGEGARYAAETFSGWESYGSALLKGEEALGGNNRRGRRVIAETIAHLQTCPASPWRLVPFSSGLT